MKTLMYEKEADYVKYNKKIFSSLMVLTLVLPLTALTVNAASDESNSPVFDNEGLQGDKFEIPTLQLGEKQSHKAMR